MRARRGFSFVEMLVVLIFIGLLVNLAIPRYHDMKRRATAAAILGDVHAVRIALFSRFAEHQTFPPETGPGIVPPDIVEYLPDGFSFRRADYEYDYEVWPLAKGTPTDPGEDTMIGVAVTINDAQLVTRLLMTASKGYGPFHAGNKVTFFITGFAGT